MKSIEEKPPLVAVMGDGRQNGYKKGQFIEVFPIWKTKKISFLQFRFRNKPPVACFYCKRNLEWSESKIELCPLCYPSPSKPPAGSPKDPPSRVLIPDKNISVVAA